MERFHGTDIVHWIGCVEERNDTTAKDKLQLGRVRVRILGFHSPMMDEDDTTGEGIPVDQLPWAYVLNSPQSASMHGIGATNMGLVEGSWVMGIALDGQAMQELYVLGSLVGVPSKAAVKESQQGFQDPSAEYPDSDFVGEEDTNRLARNNKEHPILKEKRDNRVGYTKIPTASGSLGKDGETWPEPESMYAAEYPFNHVHESEQGHVHEIDDTAGARRLHQWHAAGTYEEIGDDGSKVQKIMGEDYQIVVQNRKVYIEGNLNITVGKDANILVQEDAIVNIKGNANINVEKSVHLNAGKLMSIEAGDIIMMADKSINIIAGGILTAIGKNTNPADVSTGVI